MFEGTVTFSSGRFTLLAVSALAATSAATTVFILTVQAYQRTLRLAEIKDSADLATSPQVSRQVSHQNLAPGKFENQSKEWDPVLLNEQLARNRVFLGDDGLRKVREAFVVVVGCGGVGSWAVTMLLRSGIGKLRIIDFDQVTLSSLNRHASATLDDVGTPKVVSLQRYLSKIAPWVPVESKIELWNIDSAERLLSGNPTMVIDAIDNIDTKVDLLAYCHNHDIPVISAMGAGCKADPTRIQIDDISGSTEDPLARSTRRRLRLRGITTGITVAFSSEKPGPGKAMLLPLDEEVYKQGKVGELGVLQDFRARILPVLGTMPGIFGLAIATYVITHIGEYPVGPYIAGKNRVKMYDSVLHQLAGQKMRLEGSQKLSLDTEDVGYMIEEVFRGRSVVSRESGSGRIALTKWKLEDDWTTQNIVLMTKEEAKKHEQLVLKGGKSVKEVYSAKVLELVDRRFEEEGAYSQFRE
ncbi:hypothetical protein V1512DRAFT_266170 [Lipomyces arxii]|uniref:uncharacterized protein n=1 Tax=Lipomyces arxii TaxID=56418 RepID=UPI0034CEDFAB